MALWLGAAFWFGAHAATSFANPAFQTQWQQGEAITPNLWGPLANAKDGQQEPYKDAPGGTRLVQYFDKGRMELTGGAVTNGLLATELIRGQIQIGDNTFQAKDPPSIPVAGDPANPGPTYAGLAGKGRALFDAAPKQTGNYAQAVVSPAGDISAGTAGPSDATTFTVYDDATQHNVPRAFADYRTKVGLATIGYAKCEPFTATVKVGGQPKPVMVQVFERRVLTYTDSNPDAFRVEMGNIGQHYYQWRYGTGSTSATNAPPTAPPVGRSPTATPDPSLHYAVTATLTPPNPQITDTPVLTARLTLNGQGVAGASMSTTWHLRTQDVYCDAGGSNADGVLSCAHVISKATPGVQCTIEVFVSYQNQIYTTTVNFTPKASSL
jgi:hypothetical protein